MCSGLKNAILGLLYSLTAAQIATIAALVTAAILNGSWWLAWAATAVVVIAIAATTLGAGLFTGAMTIYWNGYRNCMDGNLFVPITWVCAGPRAAFLVLSIMLATALAGQFVSLSLILAIASIPGVGAALMGALIPTLLVTSALIVALIAAFKTLDACLNRAVGTIPPRPPTQTLPFPMEVNDLEYALLSCAANESECADEDMRPVYQGHARSVYFTSLTFAVLVKVKGSGAIQTIGASATDAFGTTASVPAAAILEPGRHKFHDPTFWAVRFHWADLSAAGLRVEPAARKRLWDIEVIATLIDGSQKTLAMNVLVSS